MLKKIAYMTLHRESQKAIFKEVINLRLGNEKLLQPLFLTRSLVFNFIGNLFSKT
jgi:hypothetical protein